MSSSPRAGITRPGTPSGAFPGILAIVFLDATGLALLIPVIPHIVRPFRDDALTISLLAFTYSLSQFVSTPFLGAWSDRWGRRPVLAVSFLGSAMAYFAFGWAHALWVLFLGRFVDGLTGANIGTSQAYIADITEPDERSRGMALAFVLFGVGFMVGPVLGLLLFQNAPNEQALAAGVLALASTVLTLWLLPEPISRIDDRAARPSLNPLAPLKGALGRPSLRALIAVNFLSNLAISPLRALFALFTVAHLAFSPDDANRVLGFLGLMMVIAQGGLVRRAVSRWGDRRTLLVGLAVSVAGFSALAATSAVWHLYVGAALTAIGVGLSLPTMAALVSRAAAPHEQGAMLGAAQAASALGQVIGPIGAGLLFDHVTPGAPFGAAAVLVLIAFSVTFVTRQQS